MKSFWKVLLQVALEALKVAGKEAYKDARKKTDEIILGEKPDVTVEYDSNFKEEK